MRPIVYLFLCYTLLSFSLQTNNETRFERGKALFRSALIEHFIHPAQLDQQNWRLCEKMIRHLIEKRDDDFVHVNIERAFKSSEDTHIFRPVFVYADGQKYHMAAFRIMQ